jgi:hypothetical protein
MTPSELLRELHESHQRVKAISDAARALEQHLRGIVAPELAAWRQASEEAEKDRNDERTGVAQ